MNQIWLMLGLKPDGFRAGMKKAVDDTKEFEKGWKGLAKIFAAGGVTTVILGFLKQMASEAQKTRGELEKLGEPIPKSVAALSALGDAFDGLGTIAGTVVGTILSGWKQLFDAGGSIINRMRGISEAQENIALAAAKGAEEQEAALAKARAANSPEKIKAAERDLAEFRRKNAYEALDNEGKMKALLEENVRLQDLASTTKADTLIGIKTEKDLEANLLEMRKVSGALKKEEAETDEKAAKAREAAASKEAAAAAARNAKQAEMNRLAAAEAAAREKAAAAAERVKNAQVELDRLNHKNDNDYLLHQQSTYMVDGKWYSGQSLSQKDFQSASDAEIQELIRRRQMDISGIKSNFGTGLTAGTDVATGGLVRGIVSGLLETDVIRARAELDQRNKLRNDVNLVGVEGARRNFAGDPLTFDRLAQEWTGQQDKQDRTNRTLDEINRAVQSSNATSKQLAALLDKGVPTVIQGGG